MATGLLGFADEMTYLRTHDPHKASVQEALVAFSRMHRTEQQDFWREINELAKELVSYPRNYVADARNEASLDFCEKIAGLDQLFPYI